MPTYKAPVDDVQFLLNDVFHMERYGNLPGFADATPDTLAAILEEAAKLAEEVIAPLNRVGDLEGCKRHADGSVTTPTGFKEAYKQYAEGGWMGLSVPQEYGGQGLPGTWTVMINELLGGANVAFSMYPGLTLGAIAALLHHGSDEIKKTYLPQHDVRQMDRHDEPDRAALRHGPRALARQGGAAGRRQLQDHRHEDLHLVRRTRHGGEHHPSRARAHRRRARRHQGTLAVRRAEILRRRPTARSASATA